MCFVTLPDRYIDAGCVGHYVMEGRKDVCMMERHIYADIIAILSSGN